MLSKLMPYLLAGISVGGQYALIAIGYTMVYGILRLINFAHGDIFTAAGFFMVYLAAALPLHGFDSADDRADGAAGLYGGARRVQAASNCAANVGNDLGHRRELSAAEPDVVFDERPGQAVSRAFRSSAIRFRSFGASTKVVTVITPVLTIALVDRAGAC